MEKRIREFVAFFVKTFLLVNFVVGALVYIFTSNRVSPLPESSIMALIAIVTVVLGLFEAFRQQ